jgi:putative SOS response-associated peptidase YedK
MCYDTLSLTKRSLDYAKRVGYSSDTIKELEEQFQRIYETRGPVYHTNGFEHAKLPVITELEQPVVELYQWGLIPAWTKDPAQAHQIQNKTLNARSESFLEKPAFKSAALRRRCLVVTDGFYEHYHFKGKTYPHLIRHRNGQPMILGGIYEHWQSPDGHRRIDSFSIVTTPANQLMKKIHNNPKVKEARMPLIIARGQEQDWLAVLDSPHDKEQLKPLIQAYPSEELEAITVGPLRGKFAAGNKPAAMLEKRYPELEKPMNEGEQTTLF